MGFIWAVILSIPMLATGCLIPLVCGFWEIVDLVQNIRSGERLG